MGSFAPPPTTALSPGDRLDRYEPGYEISAGDSDGVDYGRFQDYNKPDDANLAKWALLRCKEGAGYVQFKAN